MNHEASVDGYGRGGYRSHIIHFSSHKLGGCSRLSIRSVIYWLVQKTVHGNERGYWNGDNGGVWFRSQYTSHCLFINNVASVDC